MFKNAKNRCLKMDVTIVDYISFGEGEKVLIIIPELGDGLNNTKGMAKKEEFS